MYTAITVFITIVCILLALIVLVQNAKGGGLTAGLSSSNQIMGVRKTTDILEKLTWGFAIALFVLSISGTLMLPRNQEVVGGESEIQQQIDNAAIPTAGAPATPIGGGTQTTQPQPVQQNGGAVQVVTQPAEQSIEEGATPVTTE